MQPAGSRKLTEVHIVGQMYILQSRGINCGAEIHVVEQKYMLWKRGIHCGAQIHVVMQKYILWSRAEVTIVKQRYIYNTYCRGAYCRALVVYVSSAPTADPVIPVSCETPKALYTALHWSLSKKLEEKVKVVEFCLLFFLYLSVIHVLCISLYFSICRKF